MKGSPPTDCACAALLYPKYMKYYFWHRHDARIESHTRTLIFLLPSTSNIEPICSFIRVWRLQWSQCRYTRRVHGNHRSSYHDNHSMGPRERVMLASQFCRLCDMLMNRAVRMGQGRQWKMHCIKMVLSQRRGRNNKDVHLKHDIRKMYGILLHR